SWRATPKSRASSGSSGGSRWRWKATRGTTPRPSLRGAAGGRSACRTTRWSVTAKCVTLVLGLRGMWQVRQLSRASFARRCAGAEPVPARPSPRGADAPLGDVAALPVGQLRLPRHGVEVQRADGEPVIGGAVVALQGRRFRRGEQAAAHRVLLIGPHVVAVAA